MQVVVLDKTLDAFYQVPLHARPDDLVMVNLGAFRDELKGQRIAGRVKDGRLHPYETRAEIVAGQLPQEHNRPLVWVDSGIDAFFVQIQGSGLVRLDDGSLMRIGYAGQNGHIYTAIGKVLVDEGHLQKDAVSMQSIRHWLENNPADAARIMNQNRSYVFFRALDTDGPVGGEGLALTPHRSLAIDHGLYPYGLPFWVDIAHPETGQPRLQKLMVGQDTGGAIKGIIRGDVFWGYGDMAERQAGIMKSEGRYFVLLPKNLRHAS